MKSIGSRSKTTRSHFLHLTRRRRRISTTIQSTCLGRRFYTQTSAASIEFQFASAIPNPPLSSLPLPLSTVSIGSQIYFNERNVILTRKVSWHPYSDTHLRILSSDSVFRLFDLSSDVLQPEQEYYLQPVEAGGSRNAASLCLVEPGGSSLLTGASTHSASWWGR